MAEEYPMAFYGIKSVKRILNGSNEYVEQELKLGTLEMDMKGDSVLYAFREDELPFF